MITTHPYEAMSAAGGLISDLAMQGADVEVLAVTDGDGAAQLRHASRRRQILAGYQRLGVPEVRRHRLHLEVSDTTHRQADASSGKTAKHEGMRRDGRGVDGASRRDDAGRDRGR